MSDIGKLVKVRNKIIHYTDDDGRVWSDISQYDLIYSCPSCSADIAEVHTFGGMEYIDYSYEDIHFCKYCGQKLLWRESKKVTPPHDGKWREKPATEKQLKMLKYMESLSMDDSNGFLQKAIYNSDQITRGEAFDFINDNIDDIVIHQRIRARWPRENYSYSSSTSARDNTISEIVIGEYGIDEMSFLGYCPGGQ